MTDVEHLPLMVLCRKGREQKDAEKAMFALRRVGLPSAPIGTTAIASLAVLKLRVVALELDEPERHEVVDLADELEKHLAAIQQAESKVT